MGIEIFTRPLGLAADTYLNSRYRRILDISVSLVLVVVLAPLFCLIALSIRLSSPGPVLFRQLRYGRAMEPFELLKFRSMYSTNETDAVVRQATRGDTRVTPLGRILRCTSMDELPQLLNVIRGEMSLVGPRPHAIQHDVYYRDFIANYCTRFRTRPGITGLAQVNGARGGTPQVEDMRRRIEFDLMYLRNASFILDCSILARTLKEVFRSEDAF
jgi:putative colanic acid biosysnthesis UDP-glucose lipid carrier transferase